MKPILFNADMVLAILDGRKTVTRRAVKGVDPLWGFDGMETNPAMTKTRKNGEEYPVDMPGIWAIFESEGYPEYPMIKAPYQPGDILYVRETFRGWVLPHGEIRYAYKATGPNGNKAPTGQEYDDEWEVRPWRPSIYSQRRPHGFSYG